MTVPAGKTVLATKASIIYLTATVPGWNITFEVEAVIGNLLPGVGGGPPGVKLPAAGNVVEGTIFID